MNEQDSGVEIVRGCLTKGGYTVYTQTYDLMENGNHIHDHLMGRAGLFVMRLAGQRPHKDSPRKGAGKPRGCISKFYSIL